jgi:putative DNA-invertase from lambdoid prophage Rac
VGLEHGEAGHALLVPVFAKAAKHVRALSDAMAASRAAVRSAVLRPCPEPLVFGQVPAVCPKVSCSTFRTRGKFRAPFRTNRPMPRAFAYVRVSTPGQTTANQLQEIAAAGFTIEPRRVVTETISGSVATAQRRGFTRLLDRLEAGDVLVVTKLDRLGRNAMDVGATVAKLAELGVRVHCLALGGVDLASSTGKLTMNVINAVAEFERDLLIERTQAGLRRAKAAGKRLGRPASLTAEQRKEVARRLGEGAAVSALAREFKTSRQTILRARDAAPLS